MYGCSLGYPVSDEDGIVSTHNGIPFLSGDSRREPPVIRRTPPPGIYQPLVVECGPANERVVFVESPPVRDFRCPADVAGFAGRIPSVVGGWVL